MYYFTSDVSDNHRQINARADIPTSKPMSSHSLSKVKVKVKAVYSS